MINSCYNTKLTIKYLVSYRKTTLCWYGIPWTSDHVWTTNWNKTKCW